MYREDMKNLESDKDFTFGYKAYYPISASPTMSQLISKGKEALTELLSEIEKSDDSQYRKALLFIITHIDDPETENILVSSLEDEHLNGLSAFFLGNIFYRPASGKYNKPESFIRDKGKVLKALFPLFGNSREYPIIADRFEARPQVNDLAMASFIRIAGPDNFDIDHDKYKWIGQEIPEFTEDDRKVLLDSIERFCTGN